MDENSPRSFVLTVKGKTIAKTSGKIEENGCNVERHRQPNLGARLWADFISAFGYLSMLSIIERRKHSDCYAVFSGDHASLNIAVGMVWESGVSQHRSNANDGTPPSSRPICEAVPRTAALGGSQGDLADPTPHADGCLFGFAAWMPNWCFPESPQSA